MPAPDVLTTAPPRAATVPPAAATVPPAAATVPPAAAPVPPAAAQASRPALAGVATGTGAMVCVGGSVAVSGVLAHAPVFTAEALRYAVACVILLVLARLTGRRLVLPRGTEWLWLAGIAATRLVLFHVSLGARARPAAGRAAAARRGSHRVPGRAVRRRPGPGPGPHRRPRGGLGRGGVRLRGRVHPAGHPGPGPARAVGRGGGHQL